MAEEVEYSVSVQLRTPTGGDVWLKVGQKSSVRKGETADKAYARVTDTVERQLEAKASEWLS